MATLTAVLGATGCGPGNSGQNSASTKETACGRSDASPVGQRGEVKDLTAAVGWISREPVRVTTDTAEATGQGVMEAQRRTGTMSYTLKKNDRMILVTRYEEDVYFAMLNVPGVSFGTNYSLSRSEVPAGSYLDVDPNDPGGARRLVDAVVSVQSDGEQAATGKRRLAGAVDLTATWYADEGLCRKFGDKARAIPFNATVDDQGRLVEFVIELRALASEMGDARTNWEALGVPTNPKRPAKSQPAGDVRSLLEAFESRPDVGLYARPVADGVHAGELRDLAGGGGRRERDA
uniref:Uncharacterized protein n=2 Tax=Micromonospora TaxID=1873 RepID=A0A7D5YCM9_9ACTN|nr:hypothetical protein HZU44_15585 [Micromonospora carbonacea]